jgi:hypothetical protein
VDECSTPAVVVGGQLEPAAEDQRQVVAPQVEIESKNQKQFIMLWFQALTSRHFQH